MMKMEKKDNKKIFCVIPAFNEENSIAEVASSVGPYVDQVVVVDDGSDDATAERARRSGAVVLEHAVNRGQGAALETGNHYARRQKADIVVHFDADKQFEAADIKSMLEPVLDGSADIAVGSRFIGVESEMPLFKKKIIFPLARIFNRAFLGIKTTDPQNGFRAMNARALESIFLENDGMAHGSEFLQKMTRSGLCYREVPVRVRYSRGGQGIFSGRGRGSGGVKILKDLFISKILK